MTWWPRALNIVRKRQVFGAFVLSGTAVIVFVVGLMTFRVADRVEEQSRLSTWLLSHFASLHLGQNERGGLQDVMERTRRLEVPFIVTDNMGRPMLWNGPVVGIPMPEQKLTLLGVDPEGGNSPEIDRILELIQEYDAINEPFAITSPTSGQRFLTLHYGRSAIGRQIRWMPWAELALLTVFFLSIAWALSVKRDGEEQRLFAGMAKETAHQLGTPITSILGWVEILRDRYGDDELITELSRDVQRLGKVSERFSQIGSLPQLQDTDLAGTIAASVAYFERRLPHLGGKVELAFVDEATLTCRFNRDLMEWVLENLIKNGIDALKGRSGRIDIHLDDGPGGTVRIRVRDTGSGIAPNRRNRIFEAGFTTKARGWGMGLALVRRIVAQYHGGRIFVEDTGSQGTTFQITIPGEEPARGLQDSMG